MLLWLVCEPCEAVPKSAELELGAGHGAARKGCIAPAREELEAVLALCWRPSVPFRPAAGRTRMEGRELMARNETCRGPPSTLANRFMPVQPFHTPSRPMCHHPQLQHRVQPLPSCCVTPALQELGAGAGSCELPLHAGFCGVRLRVACPGPWLSREPHPRNGSTSYTPSCARPTRKAHVMMIREEASCTVQVYSRKRVDSASPVPLAKARLHGGQQLGQVC
jgi:hypothetical protein